MENIVQLLSWEFMDQLSRWRMKNEFGWATSPTNVNAFHTFQANAISEWSFKIPSCVGRIHVNQLRTTDDIFVVHNVERLTDWLVFISFLLPSNSNCHFAVSLLWAWNWVSSWLVTNFHPAIALFFENADKLATLCFFYFVFRTFELSALVHQSITCSHFLKDIVLMNIFFLKFKKILLRALNYGSIGSILAHEITHGFDDVGRHFDEDGNKNFWWTNTTISKFVNRSVVFMRNIKLHQHD